MLTKQATTKAARKEEVKRVGYPAYVTSAGWLGYDDDKVRRLMLEGLRQGFNHSKMKVAPTLSQTFAAVRSSAPSLTTPLTCLRGKERGANGECVYDRCEPGMGCPAGY